MRATYYGAQSEVDDQLGRLFGYLGAQGLASSTLVVLTSDHGEMGGDHWLVEKCGYWDESFHVPLIVRDPSAAADATRGLVVDVPTESVDVAPTVLDWLGAEIPVQFDGWPLSSFLHAGAAPAHWRTAAHWEWDFRHPEYRYAERRLGIPGEHCSLAVARSAEAKYVQFAAGPEVLPPLLFDLVADPGHVLNLACPWPAPGAPAPGAPAPVPRPAGVTTCAWSWRWPRRCCGGACATWSGRSPTATSPPGRGRSWPATSGVEHAERTFRRLSVVSATRWYPMFIRTVPSRYLFFIHAAYCPLQWSSRTAVPSMGLWRL